MKLFFSLLVVFTTLFSCSDNSSSTEQESTQSGSSTPVINYAVKEFFPHDTSLYTEGFLIHEDKLFESTGSPEDHPQTKSLIGIVDLPTGKIDKKIEIDRSKYFGEGIVILNSKLYQLTYTNQVGFIYDLKTFKQIGTFSYANKQGWGFTTNGKELILSDGTDKLTFLDTVALKPVRVLSVTENGLPVDNLNELEYIKGFIYANIYLTDFVVKIDPSTGKVVGRIDLASLTFEAKNKYPSADVLNGIAFDAATDKVYVTGKLWPNIYQIDFSH
ncbi:MAG: glutaminyl-peptide cyclotransferase [Ferruginibacter sp.]